MNSSTTVEKKIKVFRPFLAVQKKELVAVSKIVFDDYIKDPSNNNNKYLRTNVRKLLPLLKRHGIKEDQIIKSINNLKSSNETIKIYFNEIFKK